MTLVREFTVGGDTKRTVKFDEVNGEGEEAVGTQYLKKAVLTEENDLADAKRIRVTVEKIA